MRVQGKKMDGSIITFTGRRFFPLNPRPEDVDAIDIAHSTANQCRYTGHTKFHYSVATHSILMHDWMVEQGASPEETLWALVHDASEAYLVDLAAPIKHHEDGFGEQFLDVEEGIERAIAIRFGLEFPIPESVKAVDRQIRETEMSTLLPPVEREDWGEPLPITIPQWSPVEAKFEMLSRMYDYGLVVRDSDGNFEDARLLQEVGA